jgi:hypothetical protein
MVSHPSNEYAFGTQESSNLEKDVDLRGTLTWFFWLVVWTT